MCVSLPRLSSLVAVLVSCVVLGCGDGSIPQDSGEVPTPNVPRVANIIDVKPAPFDVFPGDSDFGFKLHFSRPVVSRGKGRELTPRMTIEPAVGGTFRWTSDSEVTFLPIDPLPADFSYEVDLTNLELPEASSLSTKKVTVRMPSPDLRISECTLRQISSDPIIKRVHMTMFLNYPLDGYYRGWGEARDRAIQNTKAHVTLTRIIEKDEQNIPVSLDIRGASMTMDVLGNDMLRPGKDGAVRLKIEPGIIVVGGKALPGAECEVKFEDKEWRTEITEKLADSEKAKEPVPAYSVVNIASSYSGKESVSVRFAPTESLAGYVSHKRVSGEILEKGLTIDPAVPGEWRIGSDTDIVFTPTNYWIPGKTYSITVDPKEFPELAVKRATGSFASYPLRGSVTAIDAGTVPEDPSRRVVSASVEFNYPVDVEALEKIVNLKVEEKGKKNSSRREQVSVLKNANTHVLHLKSEPLQLRDYPQILEFHVEGKLASNLGGVNAEVKLARQYELPSRLDIFSIRGSDTSVVKSSKEDLERLVMVTTSEDVSESDLARNVEIELLPNCRDERNRKVCSNQSSFSNAAEVTSQVSLAAEKLPLRYVDRTENGGDETFTFAFQAPGDRQVLVKIKEGLTSKLGFPLANAYRNVLHLKNYPKRLGVMMDGSLLSLSGSRRLGILAQNVRRIKYRLSRVKATDLHHWMYLASGNFKNTVPSGSLSYDDLSQPFEFQEELPETPSGKPIYTSVDFTRFMSAASELPRGLFYLEVTEGIKQEGEEQDTATCNSAEGECESDSSESDESVTSDSRLVLLTDLGMIVKNQLSGEHKVFVASFRKGEPVFGATVKLISRNGNALFTATTNQSGEVSFPNAGAFTREKEPVLYVAEKDGDLTFIPYQQRDRGVSFSRFDVGGVINSEEPDALRAIIFSDRGIYRPGESVKFGLTVRNRDLSSLMTETPLTVRISDPRGQVIAQDILRFPKLGIADYTFQTTESGTTGTYGASLILPVRGAKGEQELASINFRVEEFEPDRLAITAQLSEDETETFKKLNGLEGKITLKNLFGIPAGGNTVKASFVASPWSGYLPAYPGFSFRPMLEYQSDQNAVLDLGESETDEQGEASFEIAVPEVSGVVLEGTLAVEGFEKESGRSVATNVKGLVTDLSVLLGTKSEDALDYIEKGALRRIELRAINLKAESISSGKLSVVVERELFKNVLVRQSNGIYKYDSAKKMIPVSTSEIEVAPEGRNLELDTQNPGTFVMTLKDEAGVLLNQLRYAVVGEGNDAIKVNRNANLELTLNHPEYAPQSEVEIAIKAPYAGFGVISIEREKVLVSKWFKAEGTSSVQKIRLPAGIMGNAYVTVLLARSWESKEIYLPPLSYASLPLKIHDEEYLATPKLEIPAVVKPGGKIQVRYTSREEGAIIVYAVDEGILQFGKYRAPDPLKALVPKRALEVETRTALDLVMPDYSIVQSVLSAGGDEDADLSKFQNPFKKRTRPPLAVWSGISSVKAGTGVYEFDAPDYFDGAVKIFAYFVGDRKVGVSQSRSEIRGDFVIKPNVPTFAAPGDLFDLSVEVTNTLREQQSADVTLESPGLEVIGEATKNLSIKPNKGEVAIFRVKAKEKLGEATFKISAVSSNAGRSVSDGISIRPANPLMRTVKFGVYDPEKPGDTPERTVKDLRDMFPDFRTTNAYISHSAGLLVDSLQQFMDQYPYSCSEQLTSKAFISLLMHSYSQDELKKTRIKRDVELAVRTIASRMNADGSIPYWRRGEDGNPFVSVYAAHLIAEATEKGFETPRWMSESIKAFLKAKSRENQFDISGLFPQAYALYLRARGGEVVTPELDSLVGRLTSLKETNWKGSALSWLIGATYQQLRLEDKAKLFIADSTETKFAELPFPLSQPGFNFGVISYLRVRHFGGQLTKDGVFSLLNRLDNGAPDSLTSSALALGLIAGSDLPEAPGALKISTSGKELELSNGVIHRTDVPLGSKDLMFNGPKERHYFYSFVESGYDRSPAQQGSRTQGVAIARDVLDDEGKSVSDLELGKTYHVVLRIKSDKSIQDFALQDLLPAGFEPDLEVLKERRSAGDEPDAWACENVDVRDDRLILFGDLVPGTVVFSYPAKPTVKGTLVWPGTYGEAMYDSRIFAWEKATSITVK